MKRFTETLKWNDEEFRQLSPGAKLLWCWLLDNCDPAGVIKPDMGLATFQIGIPMGMDTLSELGSRLVKLSNGKIHIVDFIAFQYGTLSKDCKAHNAVFKSIKDNSIQGYTNPLPMGSEPSQDKDKDKEGEKDKDKTRKKSKTEIQIRAEKLFNKREETDWDPAEVRAWKACKSVIEQTSEEDWQMLEWLYSKDGEPHFPKTSFSTLMNNWSGEISKARKAKLHPDRIGFGQPKEKPTHWAEGRNPNFKLTEDIAGD